MQKLNIEIIEEAKKGRMESLEKEMRGVIIANIEGALFPCPYCNYSSKNNPKGTAKVFKKEFYKCFACGKWRRI